MLTRRVYGERKQFFKVSDVKEAITMMVECWSEITFEYIQNLFNSILKRLVDVMDCI